MAANGGSAKLSMVLDSSEADLAALADAEGASDERVEAILAQAESDKNEQRRRLQVARQQFAGMCRNKTF